MFGSKSTQITNLFLEKELILKFQYYISLPWVLILFSLFYLIIRLRQSGQSIGKRRVLSQFCHRFKSISSVDLCKSISLLLLLLLFKENGSLKVSGPWLKKGLIDLLSEVFHSKNTNWIQTIKTHVYYWNASQKYKIWRT